MLKRVSIQNFKSLKDVTLDLQKVNLLIGPNNSGKTNFLKALEFCSRWIRNETISILEVRNSTNKSSSQKRFIGTLSEQGKDEIDKEKFQNYTLEVGYDFDQINYKESIWSNDAIGDVTHFAQSYHNITGLLLDGKKIENGQAFPSRFISIRATTYIPFAQSLFDLAKGGIIYKPDPNKLIQPSIVGTGAHSVNFDASNLIAFFDFIRDDQPNAFARIRSDLQKCVPEFTEINFQSIPSNDDLVKQFGPGTYKRLGLTDGKHGVKYWADELSEGTLYFLALLCIINQPNPPKLLLLEEPEKGIHPRRLFEVMQFILMLVEEKDVQVIMTTHSPTVVDMFKDMTESVFIFDKDDEGATHVKNLQRDIIEPETARSKELGIEPPHYTDSLGDAWTVGFLGGVPK